jgi:EAL domain-containing protein (putative c-di-GMP-specific phosphodiesterase class I)/CheY-like chemotaxis protein
MTTIRVLVADDDPTMRGALANLIEHQDTLELVALAADAEEAIELATLHRPDVALLDVKMPNGGGPRAAREIRARSPETRLVVLSAHEDEQSISEMLTEGATSYLVKGTPVEDILRAITDAGEGGVVLSGSVTTLVARQLVTRLGREREATASQREAATRIQRALDGDDPFSMVFQRIVDLRGGRIVGYEALARFAGEPSRPPDVWFREAAAVGLGLELERLAVCKALERLSSLAPELFLSVNASPELVTSAGFLTALEGAATDRIVVEITEHAPVHDYARLARALDVLRHRGVRVAIDDAGAGFASMLHILKHAPEMIKLDITLTRGIEGDPLRRALAASLVTFAAAVDSTIVAEGIETEAEAEELRRLGVRYGQGFLLGRPEALPALTS